MTSFVILLVAIATLICCLATSTSIDPARLDHFDFNQVLERFVDMEGRVDYRALQVGSRSLERYDALVGPDSPRKAVPPERRSRDV